MSYRVIQSEDTTQAASTAIAKKEGSSVRITNCDPAVICTVKWGETSGVTAAAGDTAIMPTRTEKLAIPAGASHLAVFCANGRVNLAWGTDGHG